MRIADYELIKEANEATKLYSFAILFDFLGNL